MAGTAGSGSDAAGSPAAGSGPAGEPCAAQVCGHDRAVLRAVAAGRCQLRAGCEPQLVVDGLCCADSGAARRLIDAGLLVPPRAGLERARLTAAGRAALGLVRA